MKKSSLIKSLGENNATKDESLFTGYALSYSSPKNVEDVCEIVKYCSQNNITITPRGALTGINGAGTATYNHSMDLQKLNTITYCTEDDTLWAETGATFAEIEDIVRKQSNLLREFPASPTEKSATIGGALSFNACGLRSYKYGSVADFVTEIEYCDANGVLHSCTKSDQAFQELLGSEGMFAIITRVHLQTVSVPNTVWGLMFFFPDSLRAAAFADAAASEHNISVLELCDAKCFELLHEFQSQISSLSRIPSLPSADQAAIYLELEAENEDILEASAEKLLALTTQYNGDPDNIWTVVDHEVESLRLLRHAISECINFKISTLHISDVQIKKLSCSCTFPNMSRQELIRYYQDTLSQYQLNGVIFGHIGSKKPYVNILPNSAEDYQRGLKIIEKWCKDSFDSNGSPFSECGIGKIFRDIFYNTAPIDLLNKKIKLKQKWDPNELFNPKNMILKK